MQTMTIRLSEDHVVKLQELATRFHVTPEDLVSISIEDLLIHPEDAFQHAATYVLRKNAELYRRLAA